MRFFMLASLPLLASLVCAQTSETHRDATTKELLAELTELPTCVTDCVTKALPRTECALSDLDCVCKDKAYADFTEQCLLASCTIRESLKAQRWQYKACPVKEHDEGYITRNGAYTLLALAAACVGGRFLARWRIQNSTVGIDDWLILVSYILMVPAAVLIIIMAENGMGRDIWTVEPEEITFMLKVFYIDQYFYQVVVTLTKISIVFLYLRIFPKEVSNRFTYISWAVIGGLLLYLSAFLLVFILECRPISYFWNQWDGEHEGSCADIQLAAYINGGFNVLFDLIVFFLPIPKLVKLQVRDKGRKFGAIFTFLIGLVVTACSIVRLQNLADVNKYTNVTYHYNNVGFWTGLEAYLGIICACMPSIFGPLMHFFRDTIGSRLSSSLKNSSWSRSSHNKSVTNATVERYEEVELAKHAQNRGETEKASVKSGRSLPGEEAREASADDMDLDDHNGQRERREHFGV